MRDTDHVTSSADVVAALRQQSTDSAPATGATRVGSDAEVSGLRMRDLFAIAKAHRDLSLDEVEKLLDHSAYETRLAAVCTAPLYFVKAGTDADVTAAFDIADQLAHDPVDVVHNAVGIFVKHAGRRDPERQRRFLDAHAATMPRPALRLAIIKLDPATRHRYLKATAS